MPAESPSLGSMPEVNRVFHNALDRLLQETGADRGVILFGEGSEPPKVRASVGFPPDHFWITAPLSVELLHQVRTSGQAIEIEDVAAFAPAEQNLSLMLSGIRALACAPFWGPKGLLAGLIYIDWHQALRSGSRQLLPKVQEIAGKLEGFLGRVASGGEVCDPFPAPTSGLAAQQPSGKRPSAPPVTRIERHFARPQGRSLTIFFGSLGTMLQAGLPLMPALWSLAKTTDRAMKAAVEEVARRVERGQSLSLSLHQVGVFPPMAVSLLGAGEKSGRLVACLVAIARHEESSQNRNRRLRGSLVYPAFVLAACASFLAVAPGPLLQSQMHLLQDFHQPVPWLTQLGSHLIGFFSSPLWWLTLLGGLASLSQARVRQAVGRAAYALAWRWGPTRSLLSDLFAARFTQLLALQVQAGLTLADSLQAAGDEPELARVNQEILSTLRAGEELHVCLKQAGLPKLMCEMVRVGEEAGQLDRMLKWCSLYYSAQFESRLEALGRLLEPLIMLGLGILTALLLLLTMLPFVSLMDKL